ncbi:MAG: hypothetical protein WA633_06915, partial [Stellaceae bacterium]
MKITLRHAASIDDRFEPRSLSVKRRLYERSLLASIAIVIALLFSPTVWAGCDPGPGQAAFFTDAGFKGSCVVKGIGEYPNSGAIGLPNDSISSVRLGSNAQAVICKDNGFHGDCILLGTSVSFVNGNHVGNDQVSSAKVQLAGTTECMPGSNQVAFFENADFLAPCVVKEFGDYANSAAIGLPNDSISSVRVGSNAETVVCKDNGFQGNCILLGSSVSFLNDSRVGNDQISSASVRPAGTTECTPGIGQVAFFTDAGFKGSCVLKGIGVYPNSAAIGLPNDSISSVRVGSNAQAVVCK